MVIVDNAAMAEAAELPVESDSTPAPPVMSLDGLDPFGYAGQTGFSGAEWSIFDGEKFFGGFGTTQVQQVDYWTLRARSSQLFRENLYARGLIRRLVTNEINTGLTPELMPEEQILGVPEDSLADWAEIVERRFSLWAKTPTVCDYRRKFTFGAIQREARLEALVEGDVLVVLRYSQQIMLPSVQLVRGGAVRTPLGDGYGTRNGHIIRHGVEFDSRDREVAYWIEQSDGSFKRLPAYGEKSGRRMAWLVYGTEKRLDDVRGMPILALFLQSLRDIDRCRDSVQRKTLVNSFIALYIKKTADKPGTLPITGGAVRRGTADITDNTTGSTPRRFNTASQLPGMAIEELQQGEEPVLLGGNGTDTNFGMFEEVITATFAWACEVPPEILRLAFSNNYSASQAAINEFKIYLNRVWGDMGDQLCTPIISAWMISETLAGKINAPGLLDAWRDPMQHDILAAWTRVEWYGSIKPSTDTHKQARGSKILVEEGWSTNAREARITAGTKFTDNIRRLRRENEQKAAAARPILELKQEFGTEMVDSAMAAMQTQIDDIDEQIESYLASEF